MESAAEPGVIVYGKLLPNSAEPVTRQFLSLNAYWFLVGDQGIHPHIITIYNTYNIP